MSPAAETSPTRIQDNRFASDTMHTRLPVIVADTAKDNPDYPDSVHQALARLSDAVAAGAPIPMLESPAPDYDAWDAAHRARHEDPLTWHHGEWFFAETFFYRQIIQATRWFETRRDPFLPTKQREMKGESLWQHLDAALTVAGSFAERLGTVLSYVLWSNRMDLSMTVSAARGTEAADDDLLVDDRQAIMARYPQPPQHLHIIADNAGTELSLDLVLADLCLAHGAERVVMHLKMHPTFVSDAIPADVWHLIAAMSARGGAPRDLAGRLRAAWEAQRLMLAPHFYWNSSRFLWDMPPSLAHVLNAADLVVLKGDLNYRRALGDTIWEPTTPFAAMLNYIKAPLVALRTLKSDPIVGLAPGKAEALDAKDALWRVTGQHGVIQFAP